MTRLSSRTRARNVLATAAAAAIAVAIAPPRKASANTVDGIVGAGEYSMTLATQNNPTGFGNNFSELNQALANYTPGGNLELALTGNLEGNGNGLVIFIDSRAGGAVANSAGGGFNQFGSVGGQRIDDWGNDVDGGTGVSPPTGGASVVSAGFNPDYALEINAGGGGANYFINIVDLHVPNEPSDNRDVFLGGNARKNSPTDPAASPVTQTYFRDGGATDGGDITHAFDNTNTDGVTDADASGAATATKGIEFLFEDQFIAKDAGFAVRMLPFITNGGGDFLANQFLPGLGGTHGNLGGPGGDGGTPLFDARAGFGDQFYLDVFTPTVTAGGTWSTAAWTGGAAPNGNEQAARLTGTSAASMVLDTGVILGYLKFDNTAGVTLTGVGTINFNGGSGSAILIANAGTNNINNFVNIPTDTRVDVSAGASVAFNSGMSMANGKFLTKAGPGTLTIAGTQSHGIGASIAVDQGTLNLNSNLNTTNVLVNRPNLYVSVPTAGAVANINATQQLNQFYVNDSGLAVISHSGGTRAVVANDLQVTGTGKLDIKDNKVIVKGGAVGTWNGTAYTGLTGLVASGYSVNQDFSGNGIVTSESNATGGNTLTSIGVASADDTGYAGGSLIGQPVASGDAIAMYTYGGDANLDGAITGDDYFQIDSGFPAGAHGWFNGDFNYDGTITGDDYFIIDSNFPAQGAAFPTSGGGLAGVAAVPEPASIGAVVALGGLGLLRRGRRRLG